MGQTYPFQSRFQLLIEEATMDFVGREYVFSAIDTFLANHPHGYFTIEGDPGIGKTAILAKYVQQHDCVAYFNERLAVRNRTTQFLESVCTQLVNRYNLPYTPLPPQATEDGTFMQRLLNEISPQLSAEHPLIIAVDALDEVDLANHPSGTNILYLPGQLPDHVYFVMTRRCMDALPLLLHVPQHLFNLIDYYQESQVDIQAYIRNAVTNRQNVGLQEWLNRFRFGIDKFVMTLAEKSGDNFKYLHEMLGALNNGELYHDLSLKSIPMGLQRYYQDHWQHMRGISGDEIWFKHKLPIIVALTAVKDPISVELIQDFTKVEYKYIHTVLSEWISFLRKVDIEFEGGAHTCYRFYHTSFYQFISGLQEVENERVDLKAMHGQIADTLWDELFWEK